MECARRNSEDGSTDRGNIGSRVSRKRTVDRTGDRGGGIGDSPRHRDCGSVCLRPSLKMECVQDLERAVEFVAHVSRSWGVVWLWRLWDGQVIAVERVGTVLQVEIVDVLVNQRVAGWSILVQSP